MNFILSYINNFFTGQARSVKAKKHILISLLFKGMSIITGLALVPLILDFLDAERYGIWLTLSSIIAWVSFFDIGLGNGMRNKFAEAIAKDEHKVAKEYVSTTYITLGVLFIFIMAAFTFINPYINWTSILNTKALANNELSVVALIVFNFFILRLFFKLIGTILLADQRPGINNSFGPIANLLSVLIIFILTKTSDGSLIVLASILSITPVLVLIVASLFFFNNEYREYRPSLKFFDIHKIKDLMGLGLKFFYFQIVSVVVFQTSNIFIAQFASQETVTEFNVAFKYLFISHMVFGIILTPIWSAVTDAYSRGDFKWLKNSLRKYNILSIIFSSTLVLQLLISPYVYELWVGDKVNIPFTLSLIITVYLIIQNFIAPYSSFINGFGKLKVGVYTITVQLLIFIPSALILGKLYGVSGIVGAMIINRLPNLIIEPIQTYLIINQKAQGIWAK